MTASRLRVIYYTIYYCEVNAGLRITLFLQCTNIWIIAESDRQPAIRVCFAIPRNQVQCLLHIEI